MAKTKKLTGRNHQDRRHKSSSSATILDGENVRDDLGRTRSQSKIARSFSDGDDEPSSRKTIKIKRTESTDIRAETNQVATTKQTSAEMNVSGVVVINETSTIIDSTKKVDPLEAIDDTESNDGQGSTIRRRTVLKKSVKRLMPSTTATGKKQTLSTVKVPNFSDIHKKLFEKMESIDVTVRKREERKKAASTIKENKGSSERKGVTATKSKAVVRKLYESHPGPSNTLQSDNSKATEKPLHKSSEKTKLALQERSNNNARVFAFTAKSNAKVESQPLPTKKIALNQTTRSRQELYKGRPVPKTRPQSSNLLQGVRLNRRFQLQMEQREKQKEF